MADNDAAAGADVTALVVVGVLGYLFIGGAVGYGFYADRTRRCAKCRYAETVKDDRRLVGNRCYAAHEAWATLFGLLWPLAFPALAGALTANHFKDCEGRAERKEKRLQAEHERKMAELDAQQQAADAQRVATMQSVKFLVENGIKADVPGLFGVER